MDRSMKVMFGMMTVAICLLAFTMMGNQSQQAYAGEYVGGGDRGTDPTIVWFGVNWDNGNNRSIYHRLWSDGLLQQRYVFSNFGDCTAYDSGSCGGWFDVVPPAGGDGVACGADINNDSVVDVNDIMVVIDMWGSNTVCEPTYECIDLNNLPSGMGG
jgi:hypothetical protein